MFSTKRESISHGVVLHFVILKLLIGSLKKKKASVRRVLMHYFMES